MTSRSVLGLTAGLLVGAALPAFADTVTLKNGRELHGRLVEESADSIVLRTGTGGQIVVLKEKIATFTENANWGDDQGGRATKPLPDRDDAGDEGDEGDADEGEAPPPRPPRGGPAEPGADPAADWRWPSGLTRAEIDRLTPVRDELLGELEELGPSPEERMAMVDASKLSSAERSAMDDLFTRMGYNRQRRSSAAMVRRGARDRLVSEFGLKAIPELVEALGDTNYWQARMSADALGKLAGGGDGEDAKWYCYHLDVPTKLIGLMGHQGEFGLSPAMRLDANAAMERVTGHKVGFEASEETLRTAAETKSLRDWRSWWSRARSTWQAEQKANEERREEILADLDTLRRGEMPAGKGADDDESDPLGD